MSDLPDYWIDRGDLEVRYLAWDELRPEQIRPMKDAPRDGAPIFVLQSEGAGMPSTVSVVRFGESDWGEGWFGPRYLGDILHSADSIDLLGWWPILLDDERVVAKPAASRFVDSFW